MPLTGSDAVLSAALRAGLLARPETGSVDDEALTAMCDVIASVVLLHIVTNAVVVLTTPVTGPGVVT